jgi:hypothetical protein
MFSAARVGLEGQSSGTLGSNGTSLRYPSPHATISCMSVLEFNLSGRQWLFLSDLSDGLFAISVISRPSGVLSKPQFVSHAVSNNLVL